MLRGFGSDSILLSSSRSRLRERVAVTKQFTFSCLLMAVKGSLLSTKSLGKIGTAWTQFKDYKSTETQLSPTYGLSRLQEGMFLK